MLQKTFQNGLHCGDKVDTKSKDYYFDSYSHFGIHEVLPDS